MGCKYTPKPLNAILGGVAPLWIRHLYVGTKVICMVKPKNVKPILECNGFRVRNSKYGIILVELNDDGVEIKGSIEYYTTMEGLFYALYQKLLIKNIEDDDTVLPNLNNIIKKIKDTRAEMKHIAKHWKII